MKAAMLTADGFLLREAPAPTPGPNQVLIKTSACGVCSGDLYVYQKRATQAAAHGRLGHEGSGIVAAVGAGVGGLTVGDKVTALGDPAYADYFVAAAEHVVPLPAGVDPLLALGEPIACCVHAAHRFGIRPGDRVALIGCGFMGLICLQLARLQGSGFVCAVDPLVERRSMARRCGADAVYDSSGTTGAGIVAEHGAFDVVIEAAGVQSALDLSTALVAEHGRIILIGYHQSHAGQRTVNMQQWNYKAIDVVNGHVRRLDEKAAAMREGIALLAAGKISTAPLIRCYPFDDIEHAFQDLATGRSGLFKAVLVMGDS